MESAKAAVKDFVSKSGHHDTSVHEKVAPAVTNDTTTRKHHENVTSAIDREVHQDHYHTSVQPVHDSKVLPEQHHHNLIPVEHRSHDHGNADDVKAKLATEQAKFKDSHQRVEGEHTSSVKPVVAGEHVHHHVHENIQPVVHRQTVEPHVTHTTVPIHEVHNNAAKHHTTSSLPAVGMDEFKKQGGVLTGRDERHDGFEGEPRHLGGLSSSHGSHGTTGTSSHGAGALGNTARGTGLSEGTSRGTGLGDSTSRGTGLGDSTSRGTGLGDSTSRGTGLTGNTSHGTGATAGTTGLGGSGSGLSNTGTSSGLGSGTRSHADDGYSNTGKPSLMDKLNPKVDSNGDGKPGFLK